GQVAAGHLQDAKNVAPLELGKRQVSLVRHRGRWVAEVQVLGQVVDVYRRLRGKNHESLYRVGELPNVPGPRIALQNTHRLRGDLLLAQPTALVQREEMRDEPGDILGPFTNRRHEDANDVDAVQQIFS